MLPDPGGLRILGGIIGGHGDTASHDTQEGWAVGLGARLSSGRSVIFGAVLLGLFTMWLAFGVDSAWAWWATALIAVVAWVLWMRVLFKDGGQVLDDMPLGPRPGDRGHEDWAGSDDHGAASRSGRSERP